MSITFFFKRQYLGICVRRGGSSLTHSARTPPAIHPGITIWVDKIEIDIGRGIFKKGRQFFLKFLKFLDEIEIEKK